MAYVGLNPFEFRAGLERSLGISQNMGKPVLIPLNSGLAWSTIRTLKRCGIPVLIPLNSGLAWSSVLDTSLTTTA